MRVRVRVRVRVSVRVVTMRRVMICCGLSCRYNEKVIAVMHSAND